MFKPYPLTFKPILKEQVWGGRALNSLVKLPKDRKIGEAWFMANMEGNDSVVGAGIYEGISLSALMSKYREEIMGPALSARYGARFPLLFKFIDSRDRLSVQVHPDDAAAKKDGRNSGKTEAWYVVDSKKVSYVAAGLKGRPTQKKILKMARSGRIAGLMRKYRTKKGDAFFIPAGTVHSIGPSNIIFEIQQNSDITYRLYDWGRSNLGVQRELHIQKGVAAVRHAGLKVKPAGNVSRRDGVAVRKLADCPEFGAFEAVMEKGAKYWYSGPMPLVIGVIEGEVHIDYWTSGWRQKKGSVMLMPHKFGEFGIRAVKKSKLVLTEVR